MAENFSLNELKNNKTTAEEVSTRRKEKKPTLDTSTTLLYEGEITSERPFGSAEEESIVDETATVVNNINMAKMEPVNIADIRPYKEETDSAEEYRQELIGDLDLAIGRKMDEIGEFRAQAAEEEYYNNLEESDTDESETIESNGISFPNTVENDDLFDDEEIETSEPKYIKAEDTKKNTSSKNIDFDIQLDEDEFFKDLEGEDADLNDSDSDNNEVTESQIKQIKNEVKNKISPVVNQIDLSKFTISKKPISITRLLSNETPTVSIADWVLYSGKRSISMSEFSGPEIEKIDPRNSNRNKINTYKDIFSIIYKHIVDANKPESFEAWLKTLKFFDINHLYFAIYKACFNGSNTVPYTCPKCNKMFMIDLNFDDMVKYPNDEVKKEVASILAGDTTTDREDYDVTLKQISDKYVIALKTPTVYDIIFETASLSDTFTEKYQDLLGIISYIDGFYVIDNESNELIPVDTKPDPNNIVKTTMRKIKSYYEILSSLSSDQYYNLTSYIKQITDEGEAIKYILPEVTCPKCNEIVPESEQTPETLLFTRHRLAAIANI